MLKTDAVKSENSRTAVIKNRRGEIRQKQKGLLLMIRRKKGRGSGWGSMRGKSSS